MANQTFKTKNRNRNIAVFFALIFSISMLSSCGGEKSGELSLADSTGLPGDNFSLYGALEMFKNAKNAEDFEKNLNIKNNDVNNLDLNGDSVVDYVRVVESASKNAHIFVLQVPVSKTEMQDVAVIELEKTGDKSAVVQIVGNDLLYGDSAIVEPSEGGKIEKASMMPNLFTEIDAGVEVNVYAWPIVPVVYAPAYEVYVSPVAFQVYPAWYEPIPPHPYGWYRSREVKYRKLGYAPVNVYRMGIAHPLYFPMRSNSVLVWDRYNGYYSKHGWPKDKGRNYFGPGGKERMAPSFKSHPEHGMRMKDGHGNAGGKGHAPKSGGGKGKQGIKQSGHSGGSAPHGGGSSKGGGGSKGGGQGGGKGGKR